jgi:hypothetical protein
MDFQFNDWVTSPEDLAFTKRRPSEYFADHIYLTTWYEKYPIERTLDLIGANKVLLETDIPHSGCVYPDVREHFDRLLSSCDDSTLRRLTFENATELWRLDDLPQVQVARASGLEAGR